MLLLTLGNFTTQGGKRPLQQYPDTVDILPALKGEDSPKGIFRLRVSSVLKYAFAWNVEGRRPVVTKDVLFSACSPVNGAFLPAYSGRQQRGTTSHEQSGVAR